MATDRLRRARPALLWALAAFAAIQFGVGRAVERNWLGLCDPVFADKLQRARLRRPDRSLDGVTVLMLGSSRTLFGLRGLQLEEALAAETGRPVTAINF